MVRGDGSELRDHGLKLAGDGGGHLTQSGIVDCAHRGDRVDGRHLRIAAGVHGESVAHAVVGGYADLPFVRRHAAACLAYVDAGAEALNAYADATAARSAA